MNRRHAVAISLFLAVALVAGLFAALRTTGLGASASAVPAAQVEARTRQLDRLEAQLARDAAKRPPTLPAAPGAAAAQEPRTVYVRPAPLVRVVHRHHDDEGGREAEHESQHEGAELDD